MKKKILTFVLILLVSVSSLTSVDAASFSAYSSRTCSRTKSWDSWTGIKVISLTVEGDYKSAKNNSTGNRENVKYYSTNADTWTFGWSSSNEWSDWSYKHKDECKVKGGAKFTLGVATEKFQLGLQNFSKSIYAYGTP